MNLSPEELQTQLDQTRAERDAEREKLKCARIQLILTVHREELGIQPSAISLVAEKLSPRFSELGDDFLTANWQSVFEAAKAGRHEAWSYVFDPVGTVDTPVDVSTYSKAELMAMPPMTRLAAVNREPMPSLQRKGGVK